MSVGKKVIRFGLSVREIDKAIKELEQYKRDLVAKTELLREKVAERIESLAASGFSGAIVDDLTQDSGGVNEVVDMTVTIAPSTPISMAE